MCVECCKLYCTIPHCTAAGEWWDITHQTRHLAESHDRTVRPGMPFIFTDGASQGGRVTVISWFYLFLCCSSKYLHVTETLVYVYARNIVKNKSGPQLSLPFLLFLSLSITFLCQLQLISMTKEASCSHSLTPGSGSSGKNNHQHMDSVTVHYPQCTMAVNTRQREWQLVHP